LENRKITLTNGPTENAQSCEVTVLMPCLDEAETIGICVEKAFACLAENNIAGEVVVADNGSSDGSQDIARGLGARVVAVPERGYGSALRGGIAQARGRYVIMADADDSYDFTALAPFVEKLREGYELVMGNRFKGGIKPGAMPALHRYLGNPVLTAIGRQFYGSPIGDFHCGLRGFSCQAILGLGLRTSGMEFASEMVVKATLQKLRITEVPASLSLDGRSRPPHLRSWRDGWRHLRFLLLFSPRWLFLYPGVVLMAVGLASLLWLLPGPRQLGSVTLDVHTLVFSAGAIICGFQSVAFGVLSKAFAIDAKILPEDPLMVRFNAHFSLEIGLLVGAALLVSGLAAALYAVGAWGQTSFSELDPVFAMRIVVPAVTAMVLGLQVVFSSLFYSVLGLTRQ